MLPSIPSRQRFLEHRSESAFGRVHLLDSYGGMKMITQRIFRPIVLLLIVLLVGGCLHQVTRDTTPVGGQERQPVQRESD